MNRLERADRAKALLESPMFNETFADVRADLIAKLESCGFQDIDTQHHLTLSLQLLKQIKTRLERYVDDGKQEQQRQKHQDWRDKAKQFWQG